MAIRLDQKSLELMAQTNLRFDASESTNFARELLKVRTRVFEVQFPELKAQNFIPKNTECNDTDEQYTYHTMSEYGTTMLGASYTGTAPRADVSSVENAPQGIKPITASYGYDFQEARVSARLGSQLPQRKANAARKAIAQEVNRILTFGDTTRYGITMYGIANLSNTLSFTPATGAAGSKLWSLKTPDEILADMFAIATGIVTNSNDVEHPDTLLLPLASYEIVSTRRLGDGSDTTILKHFLAVSQHVKSVESWSALDSAPNSEWTGRRMVCYQKNPDKLDYILPVEFEQFPPQMVNMETVTGCHARIGGVVLYAPKSVSYGDGI